MSALKINCAAKGISLMPKKPFNDCILIPPAITNDAVIVWIISFRFAGMSVKSSKNPVKNKIKLAAIINWMLLSNSNLLNKKNEIINPAKIAMPPNVGITSVWCLRESGLSNSFHFAQRLIHAGIITAVNIPVQVLRVAQHHLYFQPIKFYLMEIYTRSQSHFLLH